MSYRTRDPRFRSSRPSCPRTTSLRGACALAASLLALPLAAQTAPPSHQDAPVQRAMVVEDGAANDLGSGSVVYEGWYVVRAGDTFESITLRYLGDASLWRDNWRLNPELRDPNTLRPGQRLRILLRKIPDAGAVVTKTSNRVEDQLPPRAWDTARLNDVLRPKDGVRTFEGSSAELTFSDATRLTISEESMVFLDRDVVDGPEPVTKEQIEIHVGQADLSGTRSGGTGGGTEIELVIGDSVAAPTPDAEGRVETRARKSEAGAQLMVYTGESKLASGGVEIEVPQGMGSAVTEGAPPGPPEELLPAPAQVAPADGARLATPKPRIAWTEVDGAESYVVEVCRDAGCGELVRRASLDGAQRQWTPDRNLPVAPLHWRVTAASPSGLDGYPSPTRALTVLTDAEDLEAPMVAFEAGGPHVPPRTALNDRWILGPGASLAPLAEDALSGVGRIETRLDGEVVDADAWSGPWEPGPHDASFVAVDQAENQTALEPIRFVYDVDPPAYSWGVEGEGPEGDLGVDASMTVEDLPEHPARRHLAVRDPHSIWPWRKQAWQVDFDGRHVVLRPERPLRLEVGGRSVLIGPDRAFWLLAEDAVCALDFRMRYDLDLRRGGGGTELVLDVAGRDAVDNASSTTLRMTTAKATREDRRALEQAARTGPESGTEAGADASR